MTTHPALRQFLGLIGWMAVTFATGAIGALASANAASFYGQLVQPTWAPPAGLFGPVWSALYLMIAISGWLVWRSRSFASDRTTLALFMMQLAANALWSWLFFQWHLGAWAFAEILLLWLLIVLCVVRFRRHSTAAALLLLPYLGWVSFAAALNLALWRANPTVLG
ncbi:MAG: TspO/MBR family protein [Burkholderiaceae bacterium]